MTVLGHQAALYYECHITIEPVFDDRLVEFKDIAEVHGFHVADLLMKKRQNDTATRSASDSFCTSRSKQWEDIVLRGKYLLIDLQNAGFMVYRYKVEDTVLDSRHEDVWGLL